VDGAFAGGAWGAEQSFTITNAEPVRLHIAASNAMPQIDWPVRHLDFTVEDQSALGGDWTSNNIPVTDFNGRFIAPVTNDPGPAMLYRLKK